MTSSPRPVRRQLVAALAVAVLLGIPSLILQRYVASTRGAAIGLVVAWFVVVGIGVLAWSRRHRDLRLAAGATYAVILLATVGVGYWTGFRDVVVDEDIVVASARASSDDLKRALAGQASGGASRGGAAPAGARGPTELATGEFEEADGHAGTGTAAVIQQPSGERLLTFSDFEVDPGVDVDVFLVPGDGSEVSDRIELGNLKGNVGNQQYEIPAEADLNRYGTVVLWCNPFTVRIAVARLGGRSR